MNTFLYAVRKLFFVLKFSTTSVTCQRYTTTDSCPFFFLSFHHICGLSIQVDFVGQHLNTAIWVECVEKAVYTNIVLVGMSVTPILFIHLLVFSCLGCVQTQEFLVLGRQTLTELRDCIYCLTNQVMEKTGQHSPSGYFLIEVNESLCN